MDQAEAVEEGILTLPDPVPFGLTVEEQAICLQYVQGYSMPSVAKELGLSTVRVRNVVFRDNTQRYIQSLVQEGFTANAITTDLLKSKMMETLDKVSGDIEANYMLKDGTVLRGKKFDAPSTIGVLKEMGRTVPGHYQDANFGKGDGGGLNIQINIGAMTESQPIIVND